MSPHTPTDGSASDRNTSAIDPNGRTRCERSPRLGTVPPFASDPTPSRFGGAPEANRARRQGGHDRRTLGRPGGEPSTKMREAH